jgi:hypothetical protein
MSGNVCGQSRKGDQNLNDCGTEQKWNGSDTGEYGDPGAFSDSRVVITMGVETCSMLQVEALDSMAKTMYHLIKAVASSRSCSLRCWFAQDTLVHGGEPCRCQTPAVGSGSGSAGGSSISMCAASGWFRE